MADERKPTEYAWREVVKDVALVAGAIAACGGAATVIYYIGSFLAPHVRVLAATMLAVVLAVALNDSSHRA